MVIFQFAMLNYQRVCIIIGFWSILTSKHSWSVKHFHCQYSPMVPPSSVPPNAQKKHQLHPASSNHPTTKPHLWTFEIKKRHRFGNFQPHSIHENPTKKNIKNKHITQATCERLNSRMLTIHSHHEHRKARRLEPQHRLQGFEPLLRRQGLEPQRWRVAGQGGERCGDANVVPGWKPKGMGECRGEVGATPKWDGNKF